MWLYDKVMDNLLDIDESVESRIKNLENKVAMLSNQILNMPFLLMGGNYYTLKCKYIKIKFTNQNNVEMYFEESYVLTILNMHKDLENNLKNLINYFEKMEYVVIEYDDSAVSGSTYSSNVIKIIKNIIDDKLKFVYLITTSTNFNRFCDDIKELLGSVEKIRINIKDPIMKYATSEGYVYFHNKLLDELKEKIVESNIGIGKRL